MQIYTKILIGMAVGAVVGLTLGPTSTLLPHDLYRVDNASTLEFRADKDDAKTRLELPGVKVNLKALETVTGTVRVGEMKEGQEADTWVKVRFKITKQMALKANDTTTAAWKKAGVKAGDPIEVWLKLSHQFVAGELITTPIPISSIGNNIVTWVKPIGDLFMRLLKMVIVPLVFSSLLVGVASLGDVRKLGRMGGKTLGLYLMTTAIAVTIGLLAANILKPGSFVAEADRVKLESQFTDKAKDKKEAAAEAPSAIDNLLEIVPTNPVTSFATGNMLQIIFFALIFGVALTFMGAAESKIVVTFFDKVQNAMVMIIHMVMAVAPFGVAALIAEVVGTSGLSVLGALLVYSLVVMLGLLIHGGIVYVGLVKAFTNIGVMRFLKAIRPAQMVAFSTSSSSATLPVSMEVAEESLGVSNPVASFVLPLGSTVNMDGTALYQGVAAVFIAQVLNIDLTVGDQLGIVLTATMASIGAAGVPGAGMVTLAMVLTAAGIPAVGVALILGMDRILDMFRTAVNVTGDLAVTAVMAATEGELLAPLSVEEDLSDPHHGFEGRLDHDQERINPD